MANTLTGLIKRGNNFRRDPLGTAACHAVRLARLSRREGAREQSLFLKRSMQLSRCP